MTILKAACLLFALCLSEAEANALFEDCWIAPICAGGPLLTTASLRVLPSDADETPGTEPRTADDKPEAPETEESHAQAQSARKLTRRRASDSPIIDVPWSEYLRVLRGVIQFKGLGSPESAEAASEAADGESLEETLSRWGMNAPIWLAQFDQLDRRCTRVLGAAHHVLQRASDVVQQWFHGIGLCRELFAGQSSDEFT